MTIENSDLLDVVRKLRTYMSQTDGLHKSIETLDTFDDKSVRDELNPTLQSVYSLGKNLSVVLKHIENSKQFREMLKSYNMEQEEEN